MNELPLKQYQSRALDSFRQFMRRCGNLEDIKTAFYQTTEEAFIFYFILTDGELVVIIF